MMIQIKKQEKKAPRGFQIDNKKTVKKEKEKKSNQKKGNISMSRKTRR